MHEYAQVDRINNIPDRPQVWVVAYWQRERQEPLPRGLIVWAKERYRAAQKLKGLLSSNEI